jgi:hypothetical protein
MLDSSTFLNETVAINQVCNGMVSIANATLTRLRNNVPVRKEYILY